MKSKTNPIINSYVQEQIPKLKTINSRDLESMFESFSPEDLIVESGMTADDLIDSFRLSLITESLTDQYSKTFQIGAHMYGAQWLQDYVVGFWEPDEYGHADPFKNVLVDFGINETKLQLEIDEAKHTVDYQTKHTSGFHPIALTTYGMIQECITDYWYELQRGFFPASSNTAKVISKVKGREALHTVQFRNLTALQLEEDPALLAEIINASASFQMPSNHIPNVFDIERKTQDWIPKMNGSVVELLKRIILNLNVTLDDNGKLGKLLIEYATTSERKFINHVPNSLVKKALNTFPVSHGIVGEAMLEQLGLTANEKDVPMNLLEKIHFNLRKSLKRYVYEKLDIEGFLKKPESPTGPLGLS
ncbi:MAG: hypothetical protein MK369_00620 [SAR202 cluster bacterium]|nr:hypothetical protein [SAR202 cluster bacterium]